MFIYRLFLTRYKSEKRALSANMSYEGKLTTICDSIDEVILFRDTTLVFDE